MSAWPGKTVIGLTGNIATGKSVVRKMLEHLGAFGIDADGLAHRSIARGAPGYTPVLDAFGERILAPDGQIDRQSLARLVFTDPTSLDSLEKIIHPLVGSAINTLVRRAAQPVIILEAIKLIEAGLSQVCDHLWVTYTPESIQQARLVKQRGMSAPLALQRIHAQPPQEAKTALADVIVYNDDTFTKTWQQVLENWRMILPVAKPQPLHIPQVPGMDLSLQRAWPSDAEKIAALFERLSHGAYRLPSEEIMAAFGRKTYLILYQDGMPAGWCGWRTDNLVASVDELFLTEEITTEACIRSLVENLEGMAQTYQCEVLLLLLNNRNLQLQEYVLELGYNASTLGGLQARAWQEAARNFLPDGSHVFYKRLGQAETLFRDL